ncbi:MAG: aldo/keto reductase [Oscillospiraceae bacterium]|nr:aldo/keto reductase [Oscillospiraceae bacterium]
MSKAIPKRTLGKTGLEISAVTFGGIINTDETPEDAKRFVESAIDRGVNYFDVAPTYGNAQERLGPALEPFRKHVFLACKTMERTKDGAKKLMLESLKLLRTDHFDVYQMHAMSTQDDYDAAFGPDGAIETLVWAKREGLIRNIGFSTHNEDLAMMCLDAFPFDTVLFPFQFSLGYTIGWGERVAERSKADGYGLLAMKTLIHRAWLNGETRGPYPKSWCKPFFLGDAQQEALAVAAMKRAINMGAATLIPPGNFAHFEFMLRNIDAVISEPFAEVDAIMLKTESEKVKEWPIFTPEKVGIHAA